jgi:hypothetical protein
MVNWREFKRKRSWPIFLYYSAICLEGLRRTVKNFSQDTRSPVRDFNPGPPEYEELVCWLFKQVVIAYTYCSYHPLSRVEQKA